MLVSILKIKTIAIRSDARLSEPTQNKVVVLAPRLTRSSARSRATFPWFRRARPPGSRVCVPRLCEATASRWQVVSCHALMGRFLSEGLRFPIRSVTKVCETVVLNPPQVDQMN